MSIAMARTLLIEGMGSQFWPAAVQGLITVLDSGALGAVVTAPDVHALPSAIA